MTLSYPETAVAEKRAASLDRRRIIKAALAALDFRERSVEAERRAVGPVRRHRLYHVGDRENFRFQQNLVALEALRI